MQKRGLVVLFILIALLGFLMGREAKLTGLPADNFGNLTVNVLSAVACTISTDAQTVSFGTDLSAGSTVNATRNYMGSDNATFYNITNDATSTVVMNVSVKGVEFISGTNKVEVGNVSWASNTTIGNGTNMVYPGVANLSSGYDTTNRIAVREPIESTAWYRLWLRIPGGTAEGTYTGNYTLQCEES